MERVINKKIMMVMLVAGCLSLLCAQEADTLDIPGNTLGVINKMIMGDTTETGQRKNINRVYRLTRGKLYYFTAGLDVRFPFTLIADDEDPGNPTKPPIVAPAILQDNSSPQWFMDIYKGDCTIKNIYFMGFRPDQRPLNAGVAIYLFATGSKLVLKNCVFDGWSAGALFNFGRLSKIFINDCVYRNMQHRTNWLYGQSLRNAVIPLDTVVMINNTMFSSGSYYFCPNRETSNYVHLEHNTIFLNHAQPLYAPYLSNAVIKNNIFYGTFTMGITEAERAMGWFDWKGEISSIASIDTIPPDLAARAGINEQDRRVEFSNNVYFWPQKIKDFWTITLQDTVYHPTWMNNRTQRMFSDDDHYPYLIAENNREEDPHFSSSLATQIDSLLKYCLKTRDGTQTNYHWWYNPDNDLFGVQWPLPEDLRYQNTALYTAGDDGFPVGDLNWFPEKKAQWEELVSGIKLKEPAKAIRPFELYANYPNPFNPVTTISYIVGAHHDVPVLVDLSIYNLLGQKVATLVSERQPAGKYEVQWDASGMASGVYLYKLQTDNGFSQSRKLVLLR